MRNIYTHKDKKSHYKFQYETNNKIAFSTNFDGHDLEHVLSELAKDFMNDNLIQEYINNPEYNLPSITMRKYPDHISVFINFYIKRKDN